MTSTVELLFSVTVRVSVLILLAWTAAFLLRRRSAGIRHLIWSSAAIGALVLVAVAPFAPTVQTTRLPVWQNCTVEISPVHIELPSCGEGERAPSPAGRVGASAPPAPQPGPEEGGPAAAAGQGGAGIGAVQRPGSTVASRGRRAAAAAQAPGQALLPGILRTWSPDLSTGLVAIWAAGALVVLLMIFLERIWVRRLGRTALEADERELAAEARETARDLGLRGRVDLHLSREPVPPLSWGFWKPRILLPAGAVHWSEDQRRAVLLHELGHARRRDVFTQTLAALSCAVFWFNPLVWIAAARMRDERERACDDLVLESGVGPASYAGSLLDLARQLSPSSGSRIALVGMTRGPDLAERVDRLVSRASPRRSPGRTTTLVSLLVALAVIGSLAPHVIARPDCQGRSVASSPAYSVLLDSPDLLSERGGRADSP